MRREPCSQGTVLILLVIIGDLQLWPVEVPNFKEHVLDLWKDTHELSLRVLSTVTIGMGLVSSILAGLTTYVIGPLTIN